MFFATVEYARSAPGKRALLSIDARVNLVAFAVVAVVALFVLSSINAMGVVFVYLAAWYVASGGVVGSLLSHLKRAAWFVAIILVVNGWFVPGEALFSVGGRVVLSKEGVAAGVFFSLRLLVLYMSVVVFLLAVPPAEIAKGVWGLSKPLSAKLADRLAFYAFLTLSFLPLFAAEFGRVSTAQSFRGANLKGGMLRRIASIRLLLVPLIVSAIHRSGQMAAVVELRGLKDKVGGLARPKSSTAANCGFVALTLLALTLSVFVLGKG